MQIKFGQCMSYVEDCRIFLSKQNAIMGRSFHSDAQCPQPARWTKSTRKSIYKVTYNMIMLTWKTIL